MEIILMNSVGIISYRSRADLPLLTKASRAENIDGFFRAREFSCGRLVFAIHQDF